MGTDPTQQPPTVTVLMSVFNGDPHLAEAIDSILNQSYRDLEMLVINDGSTDHSSHVLSLIDDPRLKIVNQEHRGLTVSLNRGLELARGKYLARLDADDIALPTRLEKQVSFLDHHPDIAVLGTACIIDDQVRERQRQHLVPLSHEEIRRAFIDGNPIVHSSVMMRTSTVRSAGGYDPSFVFAQDYDLWLRLSAVTRLANLPEPLVVHRHHWQAISIAHAGNLSRALCAVRVRARVFREQKLPLRFVSKVIQPFIFAAIDMLSILRARLRGRRGPAV